MESHKCKLCPRIFVNGKALGGHMKAHLATHPLPPPKPQLSESSSASSDDDDDDEDVEEEEIGNNEEQGPMIYGLRENPRKSCRFADPEFSFAVVDAGSVVQDRESDTETESTRNPTRRRSKRNWTHTHTQTRKLSQGFEIVKRPKSNKPSWAVADSSAVSSVSDASPEENVAICLMMLSRDQSFRNNINNVKIDFEEDDEDEDEEEEEEMKSPKSSKSKKIRGKYQCEKCKKMFRSHQALGSHRVTHKKASDAGAGAGASKIYECPFCFKIFGSGQALGGHKRSHMLGSSSSSANVAASSISPKKLFVRESSIDLNLPAPIEEDSYSVLSDAEFIR